MNQMLNFSVRNNQSRAKYRVKLYFLKLIRKLFDLIQAVCQFISRVWLNPHSLKTHHPFTFFLKSYYKSFYGIMHQKITLSKFRYSHTMHCAFSSNLFHWQIAQISINHLSGPENKKNVALEKFLKQITIKPCSF